MTDATVTPLHPASPSPAKAGETAKASKDPTAPLRARRYRNKRAEGKAMSAPAHAGDKKPSNIKPAVTVSRAPGHWAARAMRRQGATAIGIGLVAVTLTALSLSHLAHGVALVTGAEAWEAWSMAVGIDLGFVALELSQLATVSDYVRRQVSRFARPAIVGTLAGSAAMNAFAFAAQAVNPWMMAAAITLGVAIPALIYALTRVGAGLWIDCHTRA
jgi:hypothetical protein